MKKYTIIALIAISQSICLHSMESRQLNLAQKDIAPVQSQKAQIYNRNNPLLLLPPALSANIFHQAIASNRSFNDTIRECLSLTTTSKGFMTHHGNALKSYTLNERNEKMRKLIKIAYKISPSYEPYRNSLCILIYAGEKYDVGSFSLLREAVESNDFELTEALLKEGADPNEVTDAEPTFFNVPTCRLANLFIKYGVNLNNTSVFGRNVIYDCISEKKDINLIKLYLDNNVNTKLINQLTGDSLLHHIAKQRLENIHLDIAKLLLAKTSDMINTINRKGETPIDIIKMNKINMQTKDNLNEKKTQKKTGMTLLLSSRNQEHYRLKN